MNERRYTDQKSEDEYAIERLFTRILLQRSRETSDPADVAKAAGFWLEHQATGEARARL